MFRVARCASARAPRTPVDGEGLPDNQSKSCGSQLFLALKH